MFFSFKRKAVGDGRRVERVEVILFLVRGVWGTIFDLDGNEWAEGGALRNWFNFAITVCILKHASRREQAVPTPPPPFVWPKLSLPTRLRMRDVSKISPPLFTKILDPHLKFNTQIPKSLISSAGPIGPRAPCPPVPYSAFVLIFNSSTSIATFFNTQSWDIDLSKAQINLKLTKYERALKLHKSTVIQLLIYIQT